MGAGPGEGEEVPPGLQHAEALVPDCDRWDESVPLLPHEPPPTRNVLPIAADPAGDRLGDVSGICIR